jgi:hypothetical protein
MWNVIHQEPGKLNYDCLVLNFHIPKRACEWKKLLEFVSQQAVIQKVFY